MLLTLHQSVMGYTPIEVISEQNDYRGVYVARNNKGSKVFLTVYNTDNMPVKLRSRPPKEYNDIFSLKNELFPRCLLFTTGEYDDKHLTFIVTAYHDYMSLRDVVRYQPFSQFEAMTITMRLIIGLSELQQYTNGGGHYNINPDTVLLSRNKDNNWIPHLVGLDHVSGPFNSGAADVFDVMSLNSCCSPPEAKQEQFSSATDVYSVGMLLAYMHQGHYPYPIDESMSATDIDSAVKRKETVFDDMGPKLRYIIKKAINPEAKERYSDAMSLGLDLFKFMDLTAPKDIRDFFDPKPQDRDKTEDFRQEFSNDIDDMTSIHGDEKLTVKPNICFGDGFNSVAGLDDIKRSLRRDFIDIVTHPDIASQYRILPPNMLFYGPPGTGKTFITQKLAEECQMDFFSIKPSDLGSIWIHGSQGLIKDLFNEASSRAQRNKRGCLLLVDEIDALCGKREGDNNESRAGEVAEWLTQLNDCVEKRVYVIGTTNCIDRIDKAVLRHGRIDYVMYIGMPDMECRWEIFEIELARRPHHDNIDTLRLATLTDGFTSSDIAFIVKDASRRAFEATIHQGDSYALVKISQDLLEQVIREARPSVTSEDLRRYEKLRNEFLHLEHDKRPRVGFVG